MSNDKLIRKYPWAQNVMKLIRAIELAGGEDASEEKIKKEYINLRGLVVAVHKPNGPINRDSAEIISDNRVTAPNPTKKEDTDVVLEDMSVKDLKSAAKSAGIEGYETMKKNELIQALHDIA